MRDFPLCRLLGGERPRSMSKESVLGVGGDRKCFHKGLRCVLDGDRHRLNATTMAPAVDHGPPGIRRAPSVDLVPDQTIFAVAE